jgi:hypothetical protein
MSKTIVLQFRDHNNFESFVEKEYDTMKEARQQLKELAKDKTYFNRCTETETGYESCVEIRLIVNKEIIDCKPTAWANEVFKKYEEPEPITPQDLKLAADVVNACTTTVSVEKLRAWLTKEQKENYDGNGYEAGWNSALNWLAENLNSI